METIKKVFGVIGSGIKAGAIWVWNLNWSRMTWLWALPVIAIVLSCLLSGCKETLIRLVNFIWLGIGVLLAWLVTGAAFNSKRGAGVERIKKAMEDATGAGLLILSRSIVFAVLVLVFVGIAYVGR